jgi:hypothetical protein
MPIATDNVSSTREIKRLPSLSIDQLAPLSSQVMTPPNFADLVLGKR